MAMLRLLTVFVVAPCAQAYVTPGSAIPADRLAIPHQKVGSEPWVVDGQGMDIEEGSKSSWNPLVFGLVLGLFAAAVGGRAPSALAADVDNGQSVFAANCASCHAGGENLVAPDKKLKKDALQKFGKYEPAAIVAQVTKGAGSMPAFGQKMGTEDIGDVAAYVRAQADKGW